MEQTVQTGFTPLGDAIAVVLNSLERGDVVTYGEVAEEAEKAFPHPFKWVELDNGGEGIAVLEAKHLK